MAQLLFPPANYPWAVSPQCHHHSTCSSIMLSQYLAHLIAFTSEYCQYLLHVCRSNQNLNKCWTEIRLFILTQMWPAICLPEPYSASILVFDSKYYWSTGRDVEIFSTTGDLMEDTLLRNWSDSTSPLDGRLWEAVNLLNTALCSAPETRLSHVLVLLYLSLSCVILYCLFLSYSCTKGAKLSLTGIG